MKEPEITVNGVTIEERHAMTIRVALSAFASDLKEHGLGDDEHGTRMTAGYLAALGDLFRWMVPK